MLQKSARYLFLAIVLTSLFPTKLFAQIIPDNTLGAENSTIRSIDRLKNAIEGGAIRENNLFHSFIEFSVQEGFTAEFANPEGITNIFSRVTGSNISKIFGTLGVDGAANLFLMNPNGIIFGENTAININGSFLATTAESIEFNNGNRFSAVNNEKPLLTIDFPIGLGMGTNPGDIQVNGKESNILIGADILDSTSEADTGPDINLNAKNISVFDSGQIRTVSFADSGAKAGDININAKNIWRCWIKV